MDQILRVQSFHLLSVEYALAVYKNISRNGNLFCAFTMPVIDFCLSLPMLL